MDEQSRELAEGIERHDERLVRETVKRNDYFLGVSILVAGVLVAGSVIYSVGSRSGGENMPPPAGDGSGTEIPKIEPTDVILGNADAPVTIFEFADFQCPFCARFHFQTAIQIRDQYVKTGKVKIIYRDFAFLGPESVEAALAARCAQDQGKFWEFHDALYDAEQKDGQEHNGNLKKELFQSIAGKLGMNIQQWNGCYDARKYEARIMEEKANAALYGVNSTPSFFVNGVSLVGAQPFSVFQQAIEAALKN